MMKIVAVKNKQNQKKFIEFRKKIYKSNPTFVDNNLFMIKELFSKKTSFINNKKIYVFNVEEENTVLCQGVVIYTKMLSEYVQLCFFESEKKQEKAVNLLVNKTIEIGKKYNCKKLVIGLNGHVNYGLGFLNSDYEKRNSFSASINPEYYNEYFKKLKCTEINLNTYKLDSIDDRLNKYKAIIDKINKNYTFKFFDKRQFDYYSKIYTDLNNKSFKEHKYYYKRNYKEDREMLKELFLFMKEDSLIFAFKDNKPIGFVMWYQDFNELVKPGEAFCAKHFIKNLFFNKNIKTAKVMEYGILEEYRKVGLPLGLLNQVFIALKKYSNIKKIETSWILEENKDSNSVCQAICDGTYKKYVVYEKKIK